MECRLFAVDAGIAMANTVRHRLLDYTRLRQAPAVCKGGGGMTPSESREPARPSDQAGDLAGPHDTESGLGFQPTLPHVCLRGLDRFRRDQALMPTRSRPFT